VKATKKSISEYIGSLTKFFLENKLTLKPYPSVKIVKDSKNAENPFGKTAYYDPTNKSISLYTEGRHLKDVLRSYAHELIHHHQNLSGTLGTPSTSNVNEDSRLKKIEAEAYLKGNLLFRSWEDSVKNG
jgi:hypothetical protein